MQKISDALKFFRGFIKESWNHTGKKISYLRYDNGIEFLSLEFNGYLITQSTFLQHIAYYTPELKKLRKETYIRIAMNRVLSMLKGAGLPQQLVSRSYDNTLFHQESIFNFEQAHCI